MLLKNRKAGVFALSMFIAIVGFSQPPKPDTDANSDTARVNALLDESRKNFAKDPNKAISIATEARDLAVEAHFKKGEATALKNIGLGYYYQSKYVETLDYWEQSLKIFEDIKDDIGIANLLNNIAAIFVNQGDDARGLEYALRSLELSEKTGDKLRILSALNTIGSIYYNKTDTSDKIKALNYLTSALPLCEAIGNIEGLGIISENIGEIYLGLGDLDKAQTFFEKSIAALGGAANSSVAYNGIGKIYIKKGDFTQALNYHNKALNIAETAKSPRHVQATLRDIANLYVDKKDYKTALGYYNKAKVIAEDIKAVQDIKDIYSGMAISYANTNDFKNAYKFQALYANIKDTIYNTEKDKKLGSLQFEFDLQKKQSEINLLTKDKDLQQLQIKKQKQAKNAFMIGLVLAFIIALLIFRSYRVQVKTHRIVDQQKGEIEHLLLNILPTQVAHELKTTGHATPRQYESVAVMFTDFKGFTSIADKMTPANLVKELDETFIAFDAIVEKYGLEKIKTIGDSYMCAGGIPTPDANHVLKIVKAGLEILQYVDETNIRRHESGLAPWYIRIGIHVGPLVAGVVGKKKYAYDIWGSTVNIASRMESNGEAGRVNISSATYEHIKDHYACSYRGKISAKNIGEIDMYFIDQEHKIPLNLAVGSEQEELNH